MATGTDHNTVKASDNGVGTYGKTKHLEDRAKRKDGFPPTAVPQQMNPAEPIKGYDPFKHNNVTEDAKVEMVESLKKDKQGLGEYDWKDETSGFSR